ncbi:hypothetical protein SESBI_30164 [Sesbania bispinosa]|nr:hypothetical protein SESBI_30164 [Sesbania bispinosa]
MREGGHASDYGGLTMAVETMANKGRPRNHHCATALRRHRSTICHCLGPRPQISLPPPRLVAILRDLHQHLHRPCRSAVAPPGSGTKVYPKPIRIKNDTLLRIVLLATSFLMQ